MNKVFLKIIILSIFLFTNSNAIYVKYRGIVDTNNGNFKHFNLSSSSFVNDMYYDKKNKYVLVKLKSTYYHYCGVSSKVVNDWIKSSSLGQYYLYNIKGNYDCRIYPMPNY